VIGEVRRYSFVNTMIYVDGAPVHPEGEQYAGELVTVEQQLGHDDTCGEMFLVRAVDGFTFTAFHDELNPEG
jgi:hypothetical protein